MYGGSEEELRAAELAGRVFDNLCTVTPPEMHGIRQVHTGHIGGASLDGENDTAIGSQTVSTPKSSPFHPTPHQTRGVRTQPGVSSLVEIARRESILRQLYNDKLRGSIGAIFSAVINELPRDHVFLQLLGDPSTEQYCKVRIGEVVESFLFSVQAHQYHNLAAELSKREVEVLTLSGQLEALEQQQHGPAPMRSVKSIQTERRVDCGVNVADSPSSAPNGAEQTSDELITLLEEVTREHELAKCRECLSAPTSLLATVHAEADYGDKHEYLSDVMAHLFRSVKGLLSYAEGSLDSLESLRHGLSCVCAPSAADAEIPFLGEGTAGGRVVRSKSQSRANTSNTIITNVPATAAMGASASLFQEERHRLEALAAQLQYAERHCTELVNQLGRAAGEWQRQREEAIAESRRLQQELHAKGGQTRELSHALRANETALQQLREEVQRTLADERVALQSDWAEREAVWQRELATARSQLEAAQQQLRRRQSVAATHALLTARAEAAMTRLETTALEAQTAKLELLHRCGYAPATSAQRYDALLAQEARRHAEAQVAAEARARRESETGMERTLDDLRELLHAVREDERAAEALQCAQEAASLAAVRQNPAVPIRGGRRRRVGTEAEETDVEEDEEEEEAEEDTPSDLIPHRGSRTDAEAEALREDFALSPTLSGLVAGLRAAYDVLRRRLRRAVSEATAAMARERKLRTDYAALRERAELLAGEGEQQRAELRRLWDERAAWGRQETLRGLLTRQEALLAEVDTERSALRERWAALNEKYQALERRNSHLHERCAAKEVENARLMGFLRARQVSVPSSSGESEPTQTGAEKHDAATPDAKPPPSKPHAHPTPPETQSSCTYAYAHDSYQHEQLLDLLRRQSRVVASESSGTAGLSGPPRTSCSSVMATDETGTTRGERSGRDV